MSFLNSNNLSQGLFLAGSLSLYSSTALAQPAQTGQAEHPEGRAGIATLCIEKRSYVDPETKKIITPNIYIEKMPPEGIDTGYVPGNPAAVKWQDFLNPADLKRKQWLSETDIPNQADAAFQLVKKLDKDTNGKITPAEFEEGEKGMSEEDKLTDLAFLTSLRCDDLFFTEGALNEVDLEKFPEVTALRKDLSTANQEIGTCKEEIDNLQIAKGEAEDRANKYKIGTISLGVLALGLLILLGLRKSRSSGPAGGGTAKKDPTTSPEKKKTVGSEMPEKAPEKTKVAPKAAAPARTTGSAPETSAVPGPATDAKAPAPATPTVAASGNDMEDLASALKAAGGDKSPTRDASPSGPPAGTGITADNVIIRGADGRPSAEINRSVVMAEIAYLNPKFLTDDGTAIHSNYRAGVEHLADSAMAAFGDRGADAPNPGELWRIEHGARGSMIRGGLPEAWLRTFVNGQLERWHAAGAPGMNFDSVARETMERDAARRANERSAYERWVEEALRDPVRLAGR